MINTSNEYKQMIRRNREFVPKATITLANETILQLSPSDIMSGGLRIDDSVGEKVALGTAVINKCTLTLNNFSGKFDTYNFNGAIIRPYVGLQLSQTLENMAKGVFNTDRPTVNGPIIILEALDNMVRFDTLFSAVGISFPCTALQLLQAVCLHCDVYLSTVNYLNNAYIIEKRPEDDSISCREVVAWIAQIAGSFARCNTQGALTLGWYDFEAFETESNLDGGNFDKSNPYASGDNIDGGDFTNYNTGGDYDGGTFSDMRRLHHLYSFSGEPSLGTDDIYITGVQVTDSSDNPTTVLFGTEGYVLTIADNKLIQTASQAAAIANSVGQKIVGMRFRTFSGNTMSDPSMEAGDVGYATTRRGNSYPIVFTSLSFTLGNSEPITCGAETPAQGSYRPTQEMKAIVDARKAAKQEISTYDMTVQQLTSLITNGFGLFKTEVIDNNGGVIYYMHDQPTIDESLYRWFMTSGGMIEQKKVSGVWTTVSAVDNEGNALFNVLTARGINADWINVGTIKGVRGEFDDGRVGKFNITAGGLENETFKLYEADGAPWLWMYDLETRESTTMQTVGFAKRHMFESHQEWMDLQEDLRLSKLDLNSDDLHIFELNRNGIYTHADDPNEDGSFAIISDYGSSSFYEDYAIFQSYGNGELAFQNGNANLMTNSCSVLLVDDDIYINSNNGNDGKVFVNGRDIIGELQSMSQDIQAIKTRIGLT